MRFYKSVAKLAVSVTLIGFFGLPANLDAQSKIDWAADLQYLAEQLPKKHVDFFHSLKKKDFEREVTALERRVTSKDEPVTDAQAVMGLMKLVAMTGDGHTGVGGGNNMFHYFPINFRLFDDGVFCHRGG